MSADVVDIEGGQNKSTRSRLSEMEDDLVRLKGLLAALWLMKEGLHITSPEECEAFAAVIDAAQTRRDSLAALWKRAMDGKRKSAD
jgi:hypothetical protein